MPNQSLQLPGHATDGSAWRHAAPRVSRLLSFVVPPLISPRPLACTQRRASLRGHGAGPSLTLKTPGIAVHPW